MKEYNIGLVRVATTENKDLLELHGRILEEYFPMFHVTSRCIPDQYNGIHDEETEQRAISKILKLVKEELFDKDAIIISCAGDPAVDILREEMDIPVVGAGESVAAAATLHGKRVAVLGITEDLPKAYKRILGERIIDFGRPEGVYSVNDLMTAKGRENTLKLARQQKAMGADSIAMACTGVANIGVVNEIYENIGIPVLDPVLCEGIFTLMELLRRG